MNKTPFEESQNSNDELMTEYDFDYQKAKPNRFAVRHGGKLAKLSRLGNLA